MNSWHSICGHWSWVHSCEGNGSEGTKQNRAGGGQHHKQMCQLFILSVVCVCVCNGFCSARNEHGERRSSKSSARNDDDEKTAFI